MPINNICYSCVYHSHFSCMFDSIQVEFCVCVCVSMSVNEAQYQVVGI